MKLFDQKGCLTKEGLSALADGTLDELQRLEAAEHLDYCDLCVERYSSMLEDCVLETPEKPLAPSIMERLRRRVRVVFFNRFSRVTLAAGLAILIWTGGGKFLWDSPKADHTMADPREIRAGWRMMDSIRYLENGLDQLVFGLGDFCRVASGNGK